MNVSYVSFLISRCKNTNFPAKCDISVGKDGEYGKK